MKALIKEYSITLYIILAFAISWGCIIMLAGPDNLPIDPKSSEELLPILYTSMLFGPSIAGLLLIGLVEGKSGYVTLMTRLSKWQLPFPMYLLALLFIPALAILILSLLSMFHEAFQIELWHSDNWSQTLLTGILAGIMVGLFEELGWTGFVIPRFLKRFSILKTGILVGLVWGAWHFILFWEKDSFLGVLPLMLLIGRLFAWLPPFRVFMVWLYRQTNSLLLVILAHVSLVVTTTVLVPMTLTGTSLLIWLISWSAMLWLVVIVLQYAGKLVNGMTK